MKTYSVHVELLVTGTDLLTALDAVAEELGNLEDGHGDLLDSTVGLAAAQGEVEIDVTVLAHSPGQAVDLGLSCVRAAIQATGGATPEWDEAPQGAGVACYRIDDEEGVNVRRLEFADA